MKKLLIATLSLAILASCKDDPKIVTDPGSTANISLRPVKNSLLITGYTYGAETPTMAVLRDAAEVEYKTQLNHMSFLPNGATFYNSMSDSIMQLIGFPPSSSYFVLNTTLLAPTDVTQVGDMIADDIIETPLASVGHVVYRDDTSWVVSAKVKFFDDTLVQPNTVLIETYMLADVEAKEFNAVGTDLKFPNVPNLVANPDSSSLWDMDIFNLDTTARIVSKGAKIVHQHLFIENNNKTNAYGTPLSSYWPFAGDFQNGDIIGTDDTPIRHHFNKLEKTEFDYDRRVRFVTVVWIFNPFTNVYDYVNSYSTGVSYR